jgi:CubicO group peptidase (beta-lactamase class C family)
MKLLSCFLIFILFINLPSFSRDKKIINELAEIIKEVNVPGLQLIYSKENKVQNYNVGVVMNGSDKEITSNTIFEAASLSKTVFAYAILRLYDRGIIDLDAPLLNSIGSYKRFDSINSDYSKITARMVLRHTTGLPNWGNDSIAKIMFPPDSCFSYSGEGYLFLQRVMEKKLNKPLNQIIQEEVFSPLKMENSSYVWIDKFDSVSSFGNSQEEINRHKNANAAYSLLTNTTDYSIFLEALIKGKGLKESTRKMMFEKSTSAKRFNTPSNVADPYINWGLGVGLEQNDNGNAIWHWGDNGDFKCFYMAFPEKDEILIYFTHSRYGLFITEDILNMFYGSHKYWAIKWLGCGYNSPQSIKALNAELVKRGYEHSIDVYNELKKNDSNYKLPENDLNELGFMLLQQKKNKEAIGIFKLNLSLYPESANAYDSLAEGYEANGENELAIKYFKRCLELNPKNSYASERIKKLEAIKY